MTIVTIAAMAKIPGSKRATAVGTGDTLESGQNRAGASEVNFR